MNRLLTATILATAPLLFAVSASAFTEFDTGVIGGNPSSSLIGVHVTTADVGDSFDIDWLVDSSVLGTSDQLSATGTYTVSSFSTTKIILDVTLENTTLLSSTLTNADILSTGFGVSPDATATLLTAGGVFDSIGSGNGPQQTFPGGFKEIDVCVFAQGCSGGSVNSGLHAGDMDSFSIELAGDFSSGEVDLLYFPIKFQTNIGSFEPGGFQGAVPEPTSALLFGVGALVVGFRSRRR